ncbi:class II aldolase/adducin family protein [Pseudonocardia thermophila]|jgi:Ribulose-5-phosphate 4-epimerase and related epimerases and aldolases|uniref:class II aldolase/adducin family protein n=1 Tax=Pseudonocardia thermophila TaxID=1848 RepID=UPI00248F40F3|nr:class II aldolase/adducin family protein [Pseudonocardia thermophila]
MTDHRADHRADHRFGGGDDHADLLDAARTAIVDRCRRMADDGLTLGTSGNISVRMGDRIAITPSGVPYPELTPEQICVIDLEGRTVGPGPVPSSEAPMHTAIYAATDAGAVVHTHPLYATAVSTLVDELPPIHYMIAELGGRVPVAPYATYGTPQLAAHAVAALATGSAVLHANHGATTIGPDLAKAYDRAVLLEWLCRLWHQAQLAGTPRLLPPEEIARVGELLRGYGQPRT